MKTFFSIFLLILLVSCNRTIPDPLNGLKIGSSDTIWKNSINENVQNNILFKTQSEGEFDSFLNLENDSLPVIVYINYDGYYFGKLLEYKISLNSDSGNTWGRKYVRKGAGYQKYDIVKSIFNQFLKEYGKPDKLEKVFGALTNQDIINAIEGKPIESKAEVLHKSEGHNTIPEKDNFISTWNLNDYNIIFYCDQISYLSDSVPRIRDSYISFKHKDYDNELIRLKDSLIMTYTAKDYVKCRLANPEIKKQFSSNSFYDREIRIYFEEISRDAKEDERSVESFKYDLIFVDDYNKELLRLRDNNFILQEPLDTKTTLLYNTYLTSPLYISTSYNSSHNTEFTDFEQAFIRGFEIACKVEVSAVRLDDGTIIE